MILALIQFILSKTETDPNKPLALIIVGISILLGLITDIAIIIFIISKI